MNIAGMMRLIFFILYVDFAISLSTKECRRYRDAIIAAGCDENDQALFKEVAECVLSFPPIVVEANQICQKEASPELKDDMATFMAEICKDQGLSKTYIGCLDTYLEDEDFLQQVADDVETQNCFDRAFEDHGIYSEDLKLRDE